MAEKLGIGVIGCGSISAAYMRLAPLFSGLDLRACADLDADLARARAAEFGLRADSVAELLEAPDIDLVVNLTVPAAHFKVSKACLEAGKHVYSEKPFVLENPQAAALSALAAARGLRIGSAPDTFLGGAGQLARHLVDTDAVGRITSGSCFVQSPGMEMWHPNPDFFFQPGGGPVLDMGPYYLTMLVHLLGPVASVMAMTSKGSDYRRITSEPRFGQEIKVETPTTIHALLAFRSGAQVTFVASWDVWHQGHNPVELYGREGTLYLPDPNYFGGELRMTRRGAFVNAPGWAHPFATGNEADGTLANYRGAGLADMVQGILDDRPHRCGPELAAHVVEVMLGILRAGEKGRAVEIESHCARPDPLGPEAAAALLA